MRACIVAVVAVCAASLAAPSTARAQTAPDTNTSLFAESPNQLRLGGRLSSVDGDRARYQRYQDRRDGLVLTDARYFRLDPSGHWSFRAAADNVGWRDQRFAAEYDRPGRFLVTGQWDQIPQFYSVDTATPYQTMNSPLLLDDATQRQIQNGQATLSAYVPIASQFDLRERRDVGTFSLRATPTPQLDLTTSFTTTRHVGELPWGASFGFRNDVEVALPYDSRTNDLTIGTEWTNQRNMFRMAYTGSWFENLDDTLVWDSPLRLDDAAGAPGRGQMALWPSNSAHTVSAAGYTKLARRTRVTGFVSYGLWSNDEPLQPFTINTALPQLTLPRSTSEAQAAVVSANVTLTSRPHADWHVGVRLRTYNYDNRTRAAAIPQFVSYDTSITTSLTGGPHRYAHGRASFHADATWSGLRALALTAGYTRQHNGYDYRIFESTDDDTLHLAAATTGFNWLTFRARYELADRSGSGLDESLLTDIGEQPALRHYDVANRTRNRFTGQVDVVPNELWIVSASLGAGKDDFADSYFGLQESTFRVFALSADFQQPDGFGAGAAYNYERYGGLQRSRSASPGQQDDALRDWTADSTERVDYISVFVTPPRIGRSTEARLSYDHSYAKGNYVYAVAPGGPLPTPSQLPRVYNRLQQLHVDVRHRLTGRLAATFSYLYEPFRVYDFAFDPSVVDGIVQPSSLVLGYVYRPYTANAARFGLRYIW